jgi:hypoxanthine phosphoribosyltransferase
MTTTADIQPLFDDATVRQRVRQVGERIQRELADQDPLLLALLEGSMVFLADLVRAIEAPVRYELIHVELSQQGAVEEVVDIHYPVPIEVRDQLVLVVKDVVSSGVIESYLTSQLVQLGAREIRFAALVDLPRERKVDFTVDYAAFETQRSTRLVGYGMKLEGRFGNLPYIGCLTAG